MIARLSILITTFLFGMALIALQGPRPIPPYPGDDNPQHNDQPEWCQSHNGGGWTANCACRDMEKHRCDPQNPDDGDTGEATGPDTSKCKTFCRKSHCHCASPCGG